MNSLRRPLRRAARGFTLIEVLISILIFSFGILGAVGMQARVLQMTTQNVDRARASMLANELASYMWQQQSVSVTGTAWYTAWQARVADATGTGLPAGTGQSSVAVVNGANTATITVTWTPISGSASSTTTSQFVTSVVIP